jgi:hypothetical protein
MKKLLLIFTALLMLGSVKAQSKKEEIDFMQALFGMQKKDMVADFMKLTGAKADAFWKIYDEYETKRKDLGKKRIDLLEQYVNNYYSMAPETADKWMNEVIKQGKETDELLTDYYNKVKKATDPVNALKFWHVENYILTSIRQSILSEIPFVKARK